MKVSFIVPCLNAASTLATTLGSILAQLVEGDEVLVVDNGSNDGSQNVAKGYPVQQMTCPRRGAAWARNHGAWRAQGQALAFVDADTELCPGWRNGMVAALEGHQAVRCAIEPSAWAGPSRPLDRYRWALKYQRTNGTFVEGENGFPLINTAACLFRTDSFLGVGGFDTTLERLEDTDLSLRYQRYALNTGTALTARALVRYHGSTWSYLRRSFANGRAMVRLQQRWGGQLVFQGALTELTGQHYWLDAASALARGCGNHLSTRQT
jgi:glycosyltransferase involved in cell wall biosynthesis